MDMRVLESLEAWKVARSVAVSAYRLTLQPPLKSHFGAADQIRRAAVMAELELIDKTESNRLLADCDRVVGLLVGLLKSLRAKVPRR